MVLRTFKLKLCKFAYFSSTFVINKANNSKLLIFFFPTLITMQVKGNSGENSHKIKSQNSFSGLKKKKRQSGFGFPYRLTLVASSVYSSLKVKVDLGIYMLCGFLTKMI